MTITPGTTRRRRPRSWIPSDPSTRLLAVVTVVVFVVLSLAKPGTFAHSRNLSSMALQVSDLGILALAMMVAMVIGGIDLSVTAVANLAAILAAKTMIAIVGVDTGLVTLVGVGVALVVGVVCGAANGWLIGYLGVPAILATLGTMTLFTGVATVVSSGVTVTGFADVLSTLGAQRVAFVPLPTLVLVLATGVVWLVLNRTPQGLKMYLLGANPKASMFSGVRNGRVTLLTHVLASVLAAVAGIVAMSRTNSANPNYGSSYVLVTILIVVLGGVAVTGGRGKVGGVVLALVCLQLLSTGFNMLLAGHGDSNFFKSFAWGLLLLVVVSVNAAIGSGVGRRRRLGRSKAGVSA